MVAWAEWKRSDIKYHAPAVYATGHDGKSRYTFVSSEKVIEAFGAAGWGVASAQQGNSRIAKRAQHGRHILRFRPRDKDLAMRDLRPGKSGVVYPEIICLNSSDGSSPWRLESGAFSSICENGLWVSVPGFEMAEDAQTRRHRSFDPGLAYAAAERMTGLFGDLKDTVTEMAETQLTPAQREQLATEAWHTRHPDWPALGELKGAPVLLTERRPEDSGSDLWTTYNVIQENCIRGGYRLRTSSVAPISSVARTREINAALWANAEKALERASLQA